MTYLEGYIQESIKHYMLRVEHSAWYTVGSQLAVTALAIVKSTTSPATQAYFDFLQLQGQPSPRSSI